MDTLRLLACALFLLFNQPFAFGGDAAVELDYKQVDMARVGSVKFSNDGERILEVFGDHTYREWDWRKGQIVRYGSLPKIEDQEKTLGVRDAGYLSDSPLLYYTGGFHNPYLVTWDGDTGRTAMSSIGKKDFSFRRYQVPSASGFAVQNRGDEGLWLIDLEDGSALRQLNLTYTGKAKVQSAMGPLIIPFRNWKVPPSVWHFMVSSNGSKFVLKYNPWNKTLMQPEGFLGFGDMQTGKVTWIFKDLSIDAGGGFVWADISADGRLIAVVSDDSIVVEDGDTQTAERARNMDRAITLYDTVKKVELATLVGHKGELRPYMFFSDDGSTLASLGFDAKVIFWDTANGEKIVELPKFGNVLSSGDFSSDGRRFVTGNWDGSAQVWDVATGQLLVSLYAIPSHFQVPSNEGLALLPDGRFSSVGVSEKVMTQGGQPIAEEKLQYLSVGPVLPKDW